MNDNHEETIKEIVKKINKEFKDKDSIDPIMLYLNEDNVDFKGKVVTTGFPSLDNIIGIGGLPYGRIIEIYGKESSGKSTLSLQLMKQVQDAGKIVTLIDVENSFVYEYAKKLGLSKENFLLVQPHYGEQALDILLETIENPDVGMVVLDSIAALVPKKEYEGTMEDNTIGLQARMMSQHCRKLIPALIKNRNVIIVFTNQTREKVGVMYGNPEVTSGGKAMLFYASIRLRLAPTPKDKFPKNDGETIGMRIKIKTIKNKLAPPDLETEIDLINNEGFSSFRDTFTHAVSEGIIEKIAHTYHFNDRKEVGKEKFITLLKEDNDLYNKLLIKVKESYETE